MGAGRPWHGMARRIDRAAVRAYGSISPSSSCPWLPKNARSASRYAESKYLYGLLTFLIACSFLTIICKSASIAPGAAKSGRVAGAFLFLGYLTIFGAGVSAKLLAVVATWAGRQLSPPSSLRLRTADLFLSRAGYFPPWLSVTHSKRETPVRAFDRRKRAGPGGRYGDPLISGQKGTVGAVLRTRHGGVQVR